MYKKIVPHRVTRPNVEKILNTSNTSFLKIRPCPKVITHSRKLYLPVPKQHSKNIYVYRTHQRDRTAPGLLKKCRPAALKARKRWWPAQKLQTSGTIGPKMLVVCQKNADLQHRSRNIRPPAATDRALRRALALKALLAPDCCAVGSGKLRECREPLMYDMSGEKRFGRLPQIAGLSYS